MQSAVRSLLDDKTYVETVREVILAGGCNCSRISLVGACLGAKYGLEAIPKEWMQKAFKCEETLSLALELSKL